MRDFLFDDEPRPVPRQPTAGHWFPLFVQRLMAFHARRNRSAVPAAGSAHRIRALVVDDNPHHLLVVSAQLQAMGVTPLLASDGAEAAALASELEFDIILMDLNMPLLDGLLATVAIRRLEVRNRRRAVPVMAWSNAGIRGDTLARHGLTARLNKPCTSQELADCLRKWCPGRLVSAAPGG